MNEVISNYTSKNEEVKTIISHLPPRHMDDYLAIALAKSKYPNAEIKYVHPQQMDKALLENPKIVVLDVGGDYNPEKNNFDHHQDSNLESSIVLYLKHLNMPINSPVIKIIDFIDRNGFPKAVKELGLKPSPEIANKQKMFLMADLNDKNVANTVSEVLIKYLSFKDAPNMDYTQWLNRFVEDVYNSLDKKGLLDEVKEKIKKEEEDFKHKLQTAKFRPVKDYIIVTPSESFAPFHAKAFGKKVDFIIEPNKMNPNHTSIIKNTNGIAKHIPLKEMIEEAFDKDEIVFIHNADFIAVINKPVEEAFEKFKEHANRVLPRREELKFLEYVMEELKQKLNPDKELKEKIDSSYEATLNELKHEVDKKTLDFLALSEYFYAYGDDKPYDVYKYFQDSFSEDEFIKTYVYSQAVQNSDVEDRYNLCADIGYKDSNIDILMDELIKNHNVYENLYDEYKKELISDERKMLEDRLTEEFSQKEIKEAIKEIFKGAYFEKMPVKALGKLDDQTANLVLDKIDDALKMNFSQIQRKAKIKM